MSNNLNDFCCLPNIGQKPSHLRWWLYNISGV
nr:MAG TPA: hypothetical protein [Caudoviricetes sp.]